MEFALLVAAAPTELAADAVIIAMTSAGLTAAGQTLDVASGGAITKALQAAGFEGKTAQTLPLYHVAHVNSPLVLVVGAGDSKDLNGRTLYRVAQAAHKALPSKIKSAVSFLTELTTTDRSSFQAITDLVRAGADSSYRFDSYKSKKAEAGLERLEFVVANDGAKNEAASAISWAQAITTGQSYARDLGNLPPNICHPRYLADQARLLANQGLEVTVLGEAEMEALGMGAFLAVSRGSAQEGQMIVMDYRGGQEGSKPIVLVGKGITFDTGGISLKPGAAMDEMKYDMCGAASVLGVMKAVADAKLALNVIGVIAAAENMPDGQATRPGDIVTTMSGQTVEILNTDAEGRLVLCDALTYVKRYEPAIVIDIATLTGACVVALGKIVSGLFTNDDTLANELLAAGEASHDRTWRMPLLADYQEQIDSPFADIANIGSAPNGGAITAACFLARFTKDYTWAHLDIAGVAWLSGAQKTATGRPVPLLLEYLKQRAAG